VTALYPKFEGRFTVPAAGYSITLGENGGAASTVTLLTAGNYYLTSSTSMLSTIATALDAAGAGTYSATVSDADAGTGRVTISATGVASFAITWTDTALRDALGFTANTSGAATYTGTNATPYLWLPNQKRSEPPTPEGYKGIPSTDATMTVSPSGTSYIVSYGTRYATAFTFRFVAGNKAWTALESTVNESFQTFWSTTIATGKPVRYHHDRDDDATYVSWHVAPSFSVQPEIPGFVGRGSSGASTLWAVGPYEAVEFTG
jgi:hypothetical protein